MASQDMSAIPDGVIVLFSFRVDGHVVHVVRRTLPSRSTFTGEKLLHPIATKRVTVGKQQKMFYADFFASPEIAALIAAADHFDIKADGSCGALIWSELEGRYIPYGRYDIKRDSDGNFCPPMVTDAKTKTKSPMNMDRWIPCEPRPTNIDATHWPHFRPLSEDPAQYKWYIKAVEQSQASIDKLDLAVDGPIVTIEYMGAKFNGKPSDPVDGERIVRHGSLGLVIPVALRTPIGFRHILEQLPVIEGIIVYPSDHSSPMKIRADLFEDLHWGKTPANMTVTYGHSGRGLSSEVLM